jgi:hypothetical protein
MKTAITLSVVLAMATVFAQEPAPEPKRERPALTEEQRAQKEQQLDDAWSKLSLEGKLRVMHLHRALTQLPGEERKFIHDRIERFLNMSPEEKQRLKDNADRWKNMTPEQREEARQKFRERRKQFEDKWRQEHPGEEPPPFPPRGQKPPPPPPPENSEPKTENQPKENP